MAGKKEIDSDEEDLEELEEEGWRLSMVPYCSNVAISHRLSPFRNSMNA